VSGSQVLVKLGNILLDQRIFLCYEPGAAATLETSHGHILHSAVIFIGLLTVEEM